MSSSEFSRLMKMIESAWSSEDALSEGAISVYASLLGKEPYADVFAAVESLLTQGKYRMPTAGEIKHRLVEMRLDVPDWSDVVSVLITALHCTPEHVTWASGEEVRVNERQEYIERQHVMIQNFVSKVGWEWLASWGAEDRIGEAQLRRKWEDHVAWTVEGNLALDSKSDLPRVERARREFGMPEPPPLKEIEP